jgi:hypothetical protein
MATSKVLSEALSFTPQGYLFGLTMSTAGASTTLSVAAGAACDSTGSRIMKLLASIAKTTSAWALGTAAGGLDTGAIAASTWYHFFLIQRVDTGVVDVLFSLSATAPTMPANYTLFRRIGSAKTNGSSQWIKFIQLGDTFTWDVAAADVSSATTSTTAVTTALSVPSGVQVNAIINYFLNPALAANGLVTPLDITDTAPSSGDFLVTSGASAPGQTAYTVRTNTSGQVRRRESNNGTVSSVFIFTHGWIDDRGKLS